MDTNTPTLWVLNCYLNEAGWDNQPAQVYFASQEDAELAVKAMEEVVAVAAATTDLRLSCDIYSVGPVKGDVAEEARTIAREWLENAGYEEEAEEE
jgi:hypothetical protein